jgi:hypothetical protein
MGEARQLISEASQTDIDICQNPGSAAPAEWHEGLSSGGIRASMTRAGAS